jgi:hypothetical protein
MKTKQLVFAILAATFLATLFGSATVLAPPSVVNPPTLWDTFVTNTSDDPVPVDIIDGAVDVNLDEPIEVTNPSGESLDVEVTNSLDVSGWLHTTDDYYHLESIEYSFAYPFYIDTRGYKQVTLVFYADVDSSISATWIVGTEPNEGYVPEEEVDLIYRGPNSYSESRTYDVRGHTLEFFAHADIEDEEGYMKIIAYLTT